MNKTEKFFMNVEELAEVMGISKSLAYIYVQNPKFPFDVVKINSRYTIPTNGFWEWYNKFAKASN